MSIGYNGCSCSCHRNPNVKHIMACCHPTFATEKSKPPVTESNIKYLNKDITTVDEGIIAHGCNCQGVMGSGVARFLRDKYPQIFPYYQDLCGQANLADNADSL